MISPAERKKLIDSVRGVFLGNLRSGHSRWKNTNYRFISPANKEYTFQWLWDTAFHSIVLANFDIEWAKSEIRNLLIGQWDNGFIPHIIFWGERRILPHWAYIESKFSIRPKTSALTQPPALALAVEEIYEKSQDQDFLKEILPKLSLFHRWLLANRDPDGDHLLSIISPNESGMDELPAFQVALGFLGDDPSRLRYYYRRVDILNKRYRFNSRKILNKDYFSVEELLFNTVFIEASRSLSRLFKEIGILEEALFFEKTALEAEKSLLRKCWSSEERIFYSIYSKSEKLAAIKTIASLMPLFLDGLQGEKLEGLIEHLQNPDEFWTHSPIPSVAKDEIYYRPAIIKDSLISQTSLLWRGPTWINTNWFIIKGLRKHGFNDLADQLTEKTWQMIKKEGFREFYNPETGEGYRRRDFGWSTLILDLL